MRAWAAIIGALSLVATVVGLVQAFSFRQLDTVTCRVLPPPERGNIIDCLQDLRTNAGKVVVLDWASYVGEPMPEGWEGRYPFLRQSDGGSVTWGFDLGAIAIETCEQHPPEYPRRAGQCGWIGTRQENVATEALVSERYSVRGLNYRDIGVPDNGLGVTIVGGQSINPFSSLNIETYSEGWPGKLDRAEGPYQITFAMEDAYGLLRLSPAPMTDELSSQIRCAQRQWHPIIKFLACPFT